MVKKTNESQLAQYVVSIKTIEKGTLSGTADIGSTLIEAEALCKHGQWANWLNKHFSWSLRTALRYRKVAEFRDSCNEGAFGPDVTFGDLDMSLSALYFVATADHAVAKSIALRAIDGRITLKCAVAIASNCDQSSADRDEGDQADVPPTTEEDEPSSDLSDDAPTEADDGTSVGAGEPLSVGLSLLADELDQNPENLIAAARAFDPERLRKIVSQLDRVLKSFSGHETIKQKADRAQAMQS